MSYIFGEISFNVWLKYCELWIPYDIEQTYCDMYAMSEHADESDKNYELSARLIALKWNLG